MNLVNRSILLAFSLALFSITACVPEFDHPLSDEKTSKIDNQLVGRWEAIKDEGSKDKKKSFWIFSRQEGVENTLNFREETLPLSGEDNAKTDQKDKPADAFTTRIGAARYLSVGGSKDDKGKEKSYIICRYTISKDGVLTVYLMNQEVLGRDVAARKIPGIVEYSGKNKSRLDRVRITAEPSDIAEYIKARGSECFKDDLSVKLKRVNEPDGVK